MGDIQRKIGLTDRMHVREKKRIETVHEENHTIDRVIHKTKHKDKAISARVYGDTYARFKKVCDARGLTTNACLNMLITDFVRDNSAVIE